MEGQKDIGEKICELRQRADLSVSALARELGVSRQTVVNWERGASMPTPELLYQLCRVFDVMPDALIGNGGDCEAAPLPVGNKDANASVPDVDASREIEGLKAKMKNTADEMMKYLRVCKIVMVTGLTMFCTAVVLLVVLGVIIAVPAFHGEGAPNQTPSEDLGEVVTEPTLELSDILAQIDAWTLSEIIICSIGCGAIAAIAYAARHPKVASRDIATKLKE